MFKRKPKETIEQTTPKPAIPPQSNKRPPTPKTRNMRKLTALRALLWMTLGFFLVRGMAAILFPPDTQQMYDRVVASIARVDSRITPISEAAGFATGFTRDYFTYRPRAVEDYKVRLGRYCNSNLVNDICEGVLLTGGADVSFAAVVDITPYTNAQQDITVLAVVDYTTEQPVIMDGKEQMQPAVVQLPVYLTVPVYSSPTGYLVEDMPLVTSAPKQATDYQQKEFTGTAADERVKQKASAMLGDFFKTLYSERQQRIDYYLTEDAERRHLCEINGSMKFVRIDSLTVYNAAAEGVYTAIVALRLEDKSGTSVKQRLNMTLVESGSRMYVNDINLRTYNLKG